METKHPPTYIQLYGRLSLIRSRDEINLFENRFPMRFQTSYSKFIYDIKIDRYNNRMSNMLFETFHLYIRNAIILLTTNSIEIKWFGSYSFFVNNRAIYGSDKIERFLE